MSCIVYQHLGTILNIIQCQDIAEILLKLVLTINESTNQSMNIIYVGKNKYIYCQNEDIICIILAHMLMKQITKQQNEIENLFP
jgi:hypothetical protein